MSNRPTTSQRKEVSERAKDFANIVYYRKTFQTQLLKLNIFIRFQKAAKPFWKILPLPVQVAINTNPQKPKP